MNIDSVFFDETLALLKENRLEEVILRLSDIANYENSVPSVGKIHLEKFIIRYSAKLSKIRKDAVSGLLSWEQNNIQEIQLVDGLLDLLQRLKQGEFEEIIVNDSKGAIPSRSKFIKRISLVGFPNSGKSTFLTMLFSQFLKPMPLGKRFTIDIEDVGTINAVLKSKRILFDGEVLPRTGMAENEIYWARATKRDLFKKREAVLEFVDFSGERFMKRNYRESSFRAIKNSDAIFLVIDCDYSFLTKKEIENLIDEYIFTLQMARSHFKDKKAVPIAILFLKSDILYGQPSHKKEIRDAYQRLLMFCISRFKKNSIFFVSSLGHSPFNDENKLVSQVSPNRISPDGILDPLLWSIRMILK